jgi:hypothetical protein
MKNPSDADWEDVLFDIFSDNQRLSPADSKEILRMLFVAEGIDLTGNGTLPPFYEKILERSIKNLRQFGLN